MIIDLGTELLLLDHSLLLVLPSFASLLGLLVLELSVVHDLADWRLCVRRNLNQVEVSVVRQLSCIFNAHDAYLFPVGAN